MLANCRGGPDLHGTSFDPKWTGTPLDSIQGPQDPGVCPLHPTLSEGPLQIDTACSDGFALRLPYVRQVPRSRAHKARG